jgi:hypothetical protein
VLCLTTKKHAGSLRRAFLFAIAVQDQKLILAASRNAARRAERADPSERRDRIVGGSEPTGFTQFSVLHVARSCSFHWPSRLIMMDASTLFPVNLNLPCPGPPRPRRSKPEATR